jgi:hypothetical protein
MGATSEGGGLSGSTGDGGFRVRKSPEGIQRIYTDVKVNFEVFVGVQKCKRFISDVKNL